MHARPRARSLSCALLTIRPPPSSADAATASFAPQAAPHSLVSLLILFVSLAVRALFSFSGRGAAAVAHAVAYLALAMVMLSLLKRMGPKLVDRPRLRRDLAQPWK